MTLAAFLAACVWPGFLLFAVLLKTVRDPVLLRSLGLIALPFFMLCFILLMAYGQSSIVAVFDVYFFAVVIGVGLVWRGLGDLYYAIPDLKTKLRAYGLVLVGGAFVLVPLSIFFEDIFMARTVLEGRVQNLRVRGRGGDHYIAEIAGRTVRVTTPVYERLKFLPVVRVEVGRGSDYVYEIEYLTN
jgi:hypothetical protein